MNWAGVTLIVILILNIGISLAKHGEEEPQTYNFWVTLLASIINFVLYYYAGLFS